MIAKADKGKDYMTINFEADDGVPTCPKCGDKDIGPWIPDEGYICEGCWENGKS